MRIRRSRGCCDVHKRVFDVEGGVSGTSAWGGRSKAKEGGKAFEHRSEKSVMRENTGGNKEKMLYPQASAFPRRPFG